MPPTNLATFQPDRANTFAWQTSQQMELNDDLLVVAAAHTEALDEAFDGFAAGNYTVSSGVDPESVFTNVSDNVRAALVESVLNFKL